MKNFFKNPNILNCILYLVLKLTNGIEKKILKGINALYLQRIWKKTCSEN